MNDAAPETKTHGPTSRDVRRVTLVLTSQCNLRCDYCFENDKKQGAMDWETLRDALDLGLRSRRDTVEFLFFGGEPLLEYDLLVRAVRYAEAHRPSGKRVGYRIITNGTLLNRDRVAFLAAHDFSVLLSFDGVPAMQDRRGAGTFDLLDRTLTDMRVEARAFFDALSISITVTPETVPELANSVAYFLAKGVRDINLSPVVTHTPDWRPERLAELEAQFARIALDSAHEYARSGRTPVANLRGGVARGDDAGCGGCDTTMCGVMRAETPAIDVDGSMHGCVMFAGSFQSFRNRFLRERIDSMALGDFRSPRLDDRFASFPDRVERAELFHSKKSKYSSYRNCDECSYRTRCSICPISIGNQPGNEDPHRVPDFGCAFHLASLGEADRFHEKTRHDRPVSQAPLVTPGMRRIRELATALRDVP